MSYDYNVERQGIFTESGQRMFLSIRDKTHQLLKLAGAARMQEMIVDQTGDSWTMLACVDRLIELGEISEITNSSTVAGQHRVFVARYR